MNDWNVEDSTFNDMLDNRHFVKYGRRKVVRRFDYSIVFPADVT